MRLSSRHSQSWWFPCPVCMEEIPFLLRRSEWVSVAQSEDPGCRLSPGLLHTGLMFFNLQSFPTPLYLPCDFYTNIFKTKCSQDTAFKPINDMQYEPVDYLLALFTHSQRCSGLQSQNQLKSFKHFNCVALINLDTAFPPLFDSIPWPAWFYQPPLVHSELCKTQPKRTLPF